MKIRIKDNSVRLRLTKTEVTEFIEQGQLVSTTAFGANTLTYGLVKDDTNSSLSAVIEGTDIRVYIATKLVELWKSVDQVGFSELMDLGNGQQLAIKVEKDFVCLDETEEDQSDNYPNPRNISKS